MKKFKLLLLALMCVAFLPSKADEGMWLLQLMQEQHLADRMKAQGLLLEADDIYNPNRVSLTSNPQLSSSASFLRLNVLSSLN